MNSRLRAIWEYLHTSFWFVPTLMALAAVGLSIGTLRLDSGPIGSKVAQEISWIWSGQADGARSVLSTVAESMITVAGTVFSITIAALTLASTQFGPRLLRNFTRDIGNQVVLGTFVATFLYSLLILRTVQGKAEGDSSFVPNLSVTCAVFLAAASIGVLIYFINHLADAMQAESLIATVAAELKGDIARLRPPSPPGPGAAPPQTEAAAPSGEARIVRSTKAGYVQYVDRDKLVEAADAYDLVIRMVARPGDFVSKGEAVVEAWSDSDRLSEQVEKKLWAAFSVGRSRTPIQDVRYGVRQLTEIAERALSAGINDPMTAMGCTDWLVDALADLARAEPPTGVRRGKNGKPRLLEQPVGLDELVHLAFDPIRSYGANSVAVIEHLLRAIAGLARQTRRPEDRGLLLREAKLAADCGCAALSTEDQRRRVQAGLDEACEALKTRAQPS